MTPDITKITIDDNRDRIIEFIWDLIITPRTSLRKWSKLTN